MLVLFLLESRREGIGGDHLLLGKEQKYGGFEIGHGDGELGVGGEGEGEKGV